MSKFSDKERRRAEREERKKHSPWFGKRRKTSMEGNRKAIESKRACRDFRREQ
jgi:hypothetical protein